MLTPSNRFTPIVYLPREGADRQLVEVLADGHQDYVILWYHWPLDDYTGKEDYEPVRSRTRLLFMATSKVKLESSKSNHTLDIELWNKLNCMPDGVGGIRTHDH